MNARPRLMKSAAAFAALFAGDAVGAGDTDASAGSEMAIEANASNTNAMRFTPLHVLRAARATCGACRTGLSRTTVPG
jgi:hypothetical protein